MEDNNHDNTFSMFWGPLTVTEIKKCLSLKRDPKIIGRRATISHIPLKTAYFDSSTTNSIQKHSKEENLFHLNDVPPPNKDTPVINNQDNLIKHLNITPNLNDSASSIYVSSEECDTKTNVNFHCANRNIETKLHVNEGNDTILLSSDDEVENTIYNSDILNVIVVSDDEETSHDMKNTSTDVCNVATLKSDHNILVSNIDSTLEGDNFSVNLNESYCTTSSTCEFDNTLDNIEKMLNCDLNVSQENNLNVPYTNKILENGDSSLKQFDASVNKSKDCNNFISSEIIDNKENTFKIQTKRPLKYTGLPDYKHILSPVALYINNSPRTPLVQHVPKILLKQTPSKVAQTEIEYNKQSRIQNLPEHIYKPAKRTIATAEKTLKIPNNIKKLLPRTPNIVKHEGRSDNNKIHRVIPNKLFDGDLTGNCTNNIMSLDDISMLKSKEAYIK